MSAKCKKCRRSFPDHLVTNVNYSVANPICPLCALALRNKIHGLPEGTPFNGTVANDMWEEATAIIRSKQIYNMGGHMINPPEDCPSRQRANDGGEWVNLPICAYYCERRDDCDRYQQFESMTDEERRQELIDNGVKNM